MTFEAPLYGGERHFTELSDVQIDSVVIWSPILSLKELPNDPKFEPVMFKYTVPVKGLLRGKTLKI